MVRRRWTAPPAVVAAWETVAGGGWGAGDGMKSGGGKGGGKGGGRKRGHSKGFSGLELESVTQMARAFALKRACAPYTRLSIAR